MDSEQPCSSKQCGLPLMTKAVPGPYRRTPDLCQLVFGIDLIREKILGYAVEEEEGANSSVVAACRLVQISWLEAISKCLRRTRRPLLALSLGAKLEFGLESTTFSKFINSYRNPTRILPKIPPFSVVIHTGELNIPEIRDKFEQCLLRCNSGLISLTLNIDAAMNSPFAITQLSLPGLKNLTVQTLGVPDSDSDSYTPNPTGNANTMAFIQFILAASNQLHSFTLNIFGSKELLPGFENLHLPSALHTMDIYGYYDISLQEVGGLLMKNELPRVRELLLNIPRTNENDSLYHVMDKFSGTLSQLHLFVDAYNVNQKKKVLHLPVMESLKCLLFHAEHYEWPEGIVDLETLFPKLETLILMHQTASMLRRWMYRSCFLTVKTLHISLPVAEMDNTGNTKTLTLELIQKIYQTFPNLTMLVLLAQIVEESSLAFQFIFENMTMLEEFSFSTSDKEGNVDPRFWDRLLIGLPNDTIENRESSEDDKTLDTVPQQERGKPPVSITNLSKLKKLVLTTFHSDDDSQHPSLVSDEVFHSALLTMDSLRELIFRGRFKVTFEMKRKWRKCGRKINDD